MEGCVNIFVLINWHSCHFLEETLGLELLVGIKIDLPRIFVCWSFSAESSKQKVSDEYATFLQAGIE